jgi:hypothetical protein
MRENRRNALTTDEAEQLIRETISTADNITDKKLLHKIRSGMDLQVFQPDAIEQLTNGRTFQNSEVVLAALQRRKPKLLAVAIPIREENLLTDQADISKLISSFIQRKPDYKLSDGFNVVYRHLDIDLSNKDMLAITLKVSDPDHAVEVILQRQRDGSVTFEFIDTYNEEIGRQSLLMVNAIRDALRQCNVRTEEIFTTKNIQLPTTCEYECTLAVKRRADDGISAADLHQELIRHDNRRHRVKIVKPSDMEWAKAMALENKLHELKKLGVMPQETDFIVVPLNSERDNQQEKNYDTRITRSLFNETKAKQAQKRFERQQRHPEQQYDQKQAELQRKKEERRARQAQNNNEEQGEQPLPRRR